MKGQFRTHTIREPGKVKQPGLRIGFVISKSCNARIFSVTATTAKAKARYKYFSVHSATTYLDPSLSLTKNMDNMESGSAGCAIKG